LVQIKKSFFLIILSVILLAFISPPALAGQGDGSGGGQGVPLRLDKSSPYNGQTRVSLPLLIEMTFNKNVINMAVNVNNRNCFSLYAADGSKIPVEVIMADDQIEPEKKRDIALKPLQELKPGAAYTVKVSPALQAKSGATMEGDLTITFITANRGPAPIALNNSVPPNPGTPSPAGPVEPAVAQTGGDNNTGGPADPAPGAPAVNPGTAAVATPAGGPDAVIGNGSTTGAGPGNGTAENSGQKDAVNSLHPEGSRTQLSGENQAQTSAGSQGQLPEESRGSGAGTWAAVIAVLGLAAVAGYVAFRRKK